MIYTRKSVSSLPPEDSPMTTASTVSRSANAKVATKPGANSALVPPDEQFWQHYSPHYEAPISGVSSLMVHVLVVGLFVGLGILAAIWGWNRSPDIQVQAVRIPGGGGGNPNGVGNGPGVGTGPLVEDTQSKDDTQIEPLVLPDRPPLDATQVKVAREVFDNDKEAMRFINTGNPNLDAMMKNLNKDVLNKLRDGLQPGKGEGGPGSGGGEGTGHGPSKGPGTGSGKGTLSEREKRMLRWVMIFETHNPRDYISQLHGLGAIVAIPTAKDQYEVVEDLNARPAKLKEKDVWGLNRIFWVDDKPNSVAGVLRELGIARPAAHFVAFMPQELEEKLGRLELAHKGLPEDQIFETKFKVFKEAGGYNVRVMSQTRK
jgi:hypothetical protein